MFRCTKRSLFINDKECCFLPNIIDEIMFLNEKLFIRLWAQDGGEAPKNNIYCFDVFGAELWQISQPKNIKSRESLLLSGKRCKLNDYNDHQYVGMHYEECTKSIIAIDFNGFRYRVDLCTGKIIEQLSSVR